MVAQFQVALGKGHAGARLAFDRSPPDSGRTNWWLVLVSALLTVPFTLALTLSAIASVTHASSADAISALLVGKGGPGVARLITIGPLLAMLIFALARLRWRATRENGRWVGTISARLARWELVVALAAFAVAALFFAHLGIDGFACANGVTRAC